MMRAALPTLAVSAMLASCASITQGTSQTIIFSVTPQDARCIVTRDKDGQLGTLTRGQRALTLSKGIGDLTVHCTADGYESSTQRVRSSTQTEGVMSFLFLDLGITDMVTGAMWAYPAHVTIGLERLPDARPAVARPAAPPPADAPPAVGQETAPARAAEPRIGPDSRAVERMPEVLRCNPKPVAVLVGQALASQATYSVTCTGGDSLLARCEYGTCRVLR
jgi:hypothetical protein